MPPSVKEQHIMPTDKQQAIARLLSQAGAAHGAYEERELNGVYDQNWPEWYAAYLVQHGLAGLLGAAISTGQLSQLLTEYDQEYRRERPGIGWPEFYARRLEARV